MCHIPLRATALTVALATILLSGCTSYVKHAEYDAAIADLRATDARMQEQIDGLSQKYDTVVTQLAGRVRVDAMAHFTTNAAILAEEDKPMLDDFARVIRENHSDSVITVEGFTDPAGSAAYNHALGMRRAEAVRDYLVGTGGLSAAQVRAVSYGEDSNRQVRSGAVGDEGTENRRVSLVIDYAGMSAAPAPAPST